MHRILVSLLLALVLALALVGVKRIAQGNSAGQPQVMMADGVSPPPPIPW